MALSRQRYFLANIIRKIAEVGFVNPYNWCVANKMINGEQCTVLWHVDDIKISHVDKNVVTQVIDLLSGEFGKEAPLDITRGKKHQYLGMQIEYTKKKQVQITMYDYIHNMLNELPPDMDGGATTPAANHLFSVNQEAQKLNEKSAEMFHHNVAKLLYLCKRARPDIQTAVAFLTTTVKKPYQDDLKKLCRVMGYLRNTSHIPLTPEADGTHIIKWWVDTLYASHDYMKGHTGGVMTLGKGAIYESSMRQRINTKSSTESELVAVNDVMPQILWTRYFLEIQSS